MLPDEEVVGSNPATPTATPTEVSGLPAISDDLVSATSLAWR